MIGGRGISWRAWAVLCALGGGGCDALFGLNQVHGGASDAHQSDGTTDSPRPIDGPADGTSKGLLCPGGGAPTFDEPFNATAVSNVCKPWGSAYSDPGTSILQSGMLTVLPNNTQAAVAGCTMDTSTNLGTSVTAVVTSVLTGGGAYNVLEIHTIDYQIKQGGGLLRFQDASSQDHGTVTWDPSYKYWRIRAQGNSLLFGEYSTDGVTFQQLGSVSITPPTMGKIELSFGTTTAGGLGQATVDELYICP